MPLHSYTGMYDPQLLQCPELNPPGKSYPLARLAAGAASNHQTVFMSIHSYTGMYDPHLPQYPELNPPGESYPLDWHQLLLPTTNGVHAAPLLHRYV